ncbi:MAG: DNA repair protein, partial [Clostridia bacterium]|nr:DNA repair protein [Clostridia bacterium]
QNELKTMAKGTKRLKITTNLYSQIIPYADALYDEIVDKTKKIRKIAYSFDNLLPEDYEQYDLFTDIEKLKKEKILIKSLLDIKNKFGKNAILKGTDYNPKATQRERNNQIGGHNSGTEEDA